MRQLTGHFSAADFAALQDENCEDDEEEAKLVGEESGVGAAEPLGDAEIAA